MKRRLANLPIRSKLLWLASLASALALLAAGAAIAVADFRSGRSELQHRLQTHAEMTAMHSAAVVAFDDAEAAARTLEALGADQAVVAAEIVRTDGSTLALRLFTLDSSAGNESLRAHADVHLRQQKVGEVRLWASDAELWTGLWRDGLILICVLLGAFGVAIAAASLMQRVISDPIVALDRAAATVARERDYSVRVPVVGTDELGRLVTTFNEMVAQLGERAREVAEHQSKLEQQVQARTADLSVALHDAQAAARAKADFLANMSHEIRTPMNGVIGMLDLLHSEHLNAEARSMLETARNSADALLKLINDVLDFSKIDAGKLTLEKIDVELRPLAEEVAMLFTGQAQAKGIEITCAVHNDVPAVVMGDPTRLRQVMVNLLGNAVKFTERGEVLIGIQVRDGDGRGERAPGSKATVQIVVQDTGIGMSTAVHEGLFQAFTQADSSTTRKYGGTGLGLAITKKLVHAMGGTIKVKSAPGQGSTFSVFVPLEVRVRAAPRRGVDLQGLRALIVDDNPTNRCILEHYLTHAQATPVSTSSAREGLDAARAAADEGAPFDVILLDYQMPEMDGVQFLRELRADPVIRQTRCIVLSSPGDRIAEAEVLGVSAWVTKPVRRNQLQSMLAVLAGRASDTAGANSTAKSSVASATYAGARVLLVEDNVVNQEVARRTLRTLGIEVVLAGHGAQAVALLKENPFDLVLMDMQMPVMDGYEATRTIRAWEQRDGRVRLPIVAMTANAMQGDREKCLDAGMDDYATKPIKREVLAATLARWLKPAVAERPDINALMAAEQRPAQRSETAIDPAALSALSTLMGEDVGDVLRMYLTDTPEQFSSMQAAIDAGDHTSLGRSAHSLKSSSRSVGALAIARVAEALETHARAKGACGESERLLAALRVAFDSVQRALAAVLVAEDAKAAARSGRPEGPHFVKRTGGVIG
jgi:two-component system, sensor histidine kinase and response regulator